MKIHVCQVIPVPEPYETLIKVKNYNEELLEWGVKNGVNIVKTSPEFTLGTGNVDEWSFDIEDGKPCILNRMGVIKLLIIIKKPCSGFRLCKTWANIKRQLNSSMTNKPREERKSDRSQFQDSVPSNISPTINAIQRPPLLPTPKHAAQSTPHPDSVLPWRSPSTPVEGALMR